MDSGATTHRQDANKGCESPELTTESSPDVKPPWEKVLWKPQPYPDNYIPPDFLSSLRRNSKCLSSYELPPKTKSNYITANVKQYKYLPLVLSTCAVTQHLAIIFIFVGTFILLNRDHVDPTQLVWACIAAFPIGNIVWEVMEWRDIAAATKKERRTCHRKPAVRTAEPDYATESIGLKATKSSILVLLILVTITPVLKTLTAATSSDSIWAFSAILFCLNAILADYSAANPHPGKERCVFSAFLVTDGAPCLTLTGQVNVGPFHERRHLRQCRSGFSPGVKPSRLRPRSLRRPVICSLSVTTPAHTGKLRRVYPFRMGAE